VAQTLSAPFVTYASDILAETHFGLSGSQIVKTCAAYAMEWGIDLPHPTYPFSDQVPNKRKALFDNLMAFSESQRYTVLRALCDHQAVQGMEQVQKLKLTLIGRFGHLANEALGSEIDQALVDRTEHWLGPFPDSLKQYHQAIQKHANRLFLRNVLDDLRLSLELLLKTLFANEKSLENQIPSLGAFIKDRGGSTELSNMFVKLVDYYTKYQNSYVKHDDAVIEEEVEFMLELTSSFMKHLVRLSYK
jgi:hypothetical protein